MASELSEQQIKEFKQAWEKRLSQLREEIRQELLKYDDEQYTDLAGRVYDNEDESVADLLIDLNLANIHRHVQEAREVEAALMRIGNGTYGYCSDCDDLIDIKRLKAYPSARRCLRCQSHYERSHAQEGQPTL
jgi:DnaK suppressor protein